MRGIGYLYQHNYRNKPVNKTPKPTVSFPAQDVWAAACAAQRTNGEYVKFSETKKTNRQLVDQFLADISTITQEDRDQGEIVRKYFLGMTFKIIQGAKISVFNKTAMEIATKETITGNYDIAVICSLPASFEKMTERDQVDRRINFAQGGYVGNVGDKVVLNIEVVKQLWSGNWNTWYVTGITDDDKVVFFAHKNGIEVGKNVKISGTVKGQRDTSTQLNRVKVI